MTKKKKIIIGCVIAAVIVALAVVAVFAFDIFGSKPYNYDLSEYVKVGNYKGLEYDKVKVSVTDKEVQDEIQTRCENKATTENVTTGTVKDGDTINVAYVGKIDGKTFDGGSTESSDITIGKTSMIDGFTDGLIGKKVGSEVTLNLKFPDDYSEAKVAGKDVVFKVTINSKSVTTTPDYDLKFVKANSDYDNLADYETSVKKDLLASKTESAKYDIKNNLWSGIVDKSKAIKYPEEELQAEIDKTTASYKAEAESYGVEWKKFITEYMGMDDEAAYNKAIKKYAKSVVFQKMVLYSIAEKEDIEITKDEYNKYLKNLLDEAGFTEETFKKNYKQTIEEYAEDQDWETSLLMNKVLDKILELGKEKA